jgi:hypothetical protein
MKKSVSKSNLMLSVGISKKMLKAFLEFHKQHHAEAQLRGHEQTSQAESIRQLLWIALKQVGLLEEN